MGFFDSFKKNFDSKFADESVKASQRNSGYRNIVQEESERYNNFANQDDGTLLRKYNSTLTSDSDKLIIAQILESRGYSKHENSNTYGRI